MTAGFPGGDRDSLCGAASSSRHQGRRPKCAFPRVLEDFGRLAKLAWRSVRSRQGAEFPAQRSICFRKPLNEAAASCTCISNIAEEGP